LPAQQGAHLLTMLFALMSFDFLAMAFFTARHSEILQNFNKSNIIQQPNGLKLSKQFHGGRI
jgi:hypothetical protein